MELQKSIGGTPNRTLHLWKLFLRCWAKCALLADEVKVNCMFINCPKHDFKHPLDRMGGARIAWMLIA